MIHLKIARWNCELRWSHDIAEILLKVALNTITLKSRIFVG
jgi:hypothetical protein